MFDFELTFRFGFSFPRARAGERRVLKQKRFLMHVPYVDAKAIRKVSAAVGANCIGRDLFDFIFISSRSMILGKFEFQQLR
jgi:hypothetical protein